MKNGSKGKEEIYKERKVCRSCGSEKLYPIFSLGDQYIVYFPEEGASEEGILAPVEVVLCGHPPCSLVQLKHTVNPDLIYRHFWYKSGITQTMRDALADITKEAQKRVLLKEGDIVVDIGTNDGTLLRSYSPKGLVTVGFEPAANLMEEAKKETSHIINNYFNYGEFSKSFPNQKAKVVTSIAMFYDLDDPNQFVADVKKTLAPEGLWINQMNYLRSMLTQNAFDNISHEHLEYYSVFSLQYLLQSHGLEVFDVELNAINGGSFRTYIGHAGRFPVQNRVKELEQSEEGLKTIPLYEKFASSIEGIKTEVRAFIVKEVSSGKKIYAYGASTRGNTLLQFFGLDHTLITAAAERNPAKFGKRMVGTNIPIIPEEKARQERPDYFLVLPWAFIKEFIAREKEFLKKGGQFIVPLPQFRVIPS